MDRRQLGITVTAVALTLVLSVGITLLATSGGDDEVTTGGPSTTSSSTPASTTSTTAATPTTKPPIVTVPSRPPGTVVIIPPTTTTTAARPTTTTSTVPPVVVPQATAPPAAPPTAPPTAPATAPAPVTPAAPGTTTTTPSTTTTTTPDERPGVGITATRIRLAVIADDVDVLEGARAWATVVNRRGGIAGRDLRLDLLPTRRTAAGYAAAVTRACSRDFAIVAGLSAFDADTSALECGIPDIPIEAIAPEHALHDTTYAAFPRRLDTVAVGPYRYLQSAIDGCCAQFVLVPTEPGAGAATEAAIMGAEAIGFTTAGTASLPDELTPEAFAAIVEDLGASGATFAAAGESPFTATIALRRAATPDGPDLAAPTGVEAWYCGASCYDRSFLGSGGDAVEDQYVAIETVPFTDRTDVPAMRAFLRAMALDGTPPTYAGLRAYVSGLLFQAAVQDVVAEHGPDGVTRERLLGSLAGIDGFTAGGLVGPTDVGTRTPSGCTVVLQVQGGSFVRMHPTESGNLDCDAQNLVELDA